MLIDCTNVLFCNICDRMMTFQVKRNDSPSVLMIQQLFIVLVISIIAMMAKVSANDDDLSSLSSLRTRGIPTDSTQTSSHFDDVYHEILEKKIENVGQGDDVKTTTPNIVLKPNIAGAIDVGQGLLVPLVPVIDPNSKNNQPQSSPLIANLLPVSVETVTASAPASNAVDAEMQRIDDDMDVAEDIIFRPLFRYRQEAAARRKSYNQNRYYQPYIYAYKPPRQKNYNDDYEHRRLRYYPRDYDD